MGRPLKIKDTLTKDIGFNAYNVLTSSVPPGSFTATNFTGVVGGANTIANVAYPVLAVNANINGAGSVTAFIVRQKGSIQYLVASVANTQVQGICTLANTANAALLAADTMSITFNAGAGNVVASKLTNKFIWDYSTPPTRFAVNFFQTGNTTAKSGAQISTWTNGTGLLTLGNAQEYTS
jgi:hypothetical protein